MSGIIGSKLNVRGSGHVAKLGTDGQVLTSAGAGVSAVYEDAAGGGLDWQAIETGSTMTAVAGNGYWIDTTSNACVITLPSSASNGDEIMFADYARTWGTYGIELDSNGLNYQGDDDTSDVEYGTDGTALHIVYSGATKGWIPTLDKTVEDVPTKTNDNGIFGFGNTGSVSSLTNLVSNVGVVASDVTGVGTVRARVMGCEYGGDKGIIGFGEDPANGGKISITNLVSNAGVVATDTTGVGTARSALAACDYGGDKGIFAYGKTASFVSMSNLVSNAGVVATDVTGVGTARYQLAACEYGGDKGIFGFGEDPRTGITNLVSNVGVVATDVSAVGSARYGPSACSYGLDKGIFGYGYVSGVVSLTNLVSTAGVVASDVTGVGTARSYAAATQYGKDKGIFGYGFVVSVYQSMSNLVSNVGVVATDVSGVGTARSLLAGCSYN